MGFLLFYVFFTTTVIRRFLKFYQRHKCNHSLVLDSGSDCVSGDNNQNIMAVSINQTQYAIAIDPAEKL